MGNSALSLSPCRDCPEDPPSHSETPDPDKVAVLKPEDFAQYEVEKIGKGGFRHTVAIEQLIGTYSIENSQCSYFKHRHTDGYLINSMCGRTLRLGTTCGTKFVVGFAQVQRHVEIVQSVRAERDLQLTMPEKYLRRAESLIEELRKRNDALSALRTHTLPVLVSMKAACRDNDTRVLVEVRRYDPKQEREVIDTVPRYLEGLNLFGGVPFTKADNLLVSAQKYADGCTRERATPENYMQFVNERKALEESASQLEEWLKDADKFWTESNLDLVLRRTYGNNRPGNLTIEGSMLVVLSGEQTLVIGSDGVKER